MHPFILLSIILILLIICIYVKNEESFQNTTISNQIIDQLSKILKISPRRITNLDFNPNSLPEGRLFITFDLFQPNVTELNAKEEVADKVAELYNKLVSNNNLKIKINNQDILIQKKITNNKINQETYFNHKNLLNIEKYAKKKYQVVPTDDSMTKFFKLTIDNNYKITPKME